MTWLATFAMILKLCGPPALVEEMSIQAGVDPGLTHCIVEKESSFDPYAVGDGGDSVGLWQFQLRTWIYFREMMGLSQEDLRTDPIISTETALWAINHGYLYHWSTAELCQK